MNSNIHLETLTPKDLLKAYSYGLFPMSESADDPDIFWLAPDIRGIIPLDKFYISRSLKKAIHRNLFEIRVDWDFAATIRECARKTSDRPTTWINDTILELYHELHKIGHAHTIEAWRHNKLVGGLYGVSLGSAFFGESMFSRQANASKICLVYLVRHLVQRGFTLLDTQFTTDHLRQFGAIDIPRTEYDILLSKAMKNTNVSFHGEHTSSPL